jgi:hypothetical protein
MQAPLSTIAKRWSSEFDLDEQLLASVLYKYARGDFLNEAPDPNLKVLLASSHAPIANHDTGPSYEEITQDSGKPLIIPEAPPTASNYLIEDIDEHPLSFDPPLSFESVVAFCNAHGIPYPSWLENGEQSEEPGAQIEQAENSFILTGDHWAITYQGHTKTFNNTKGLRYIAFLIQNQGKEVLVTDLYYAINPPDSKTIDSTHSDMTVDQLNEMHLSVGDLGNAGDTLTPKGKTRLKEEVRNIQEQIEEATELGDDVTVAELEQKQEDILGYIAAESGLGGKTRKASSDIERQRKAVSKRISSDIKKITTTFPDLGHHLNETIHTGTQCHYSPHPQIEWLFEAE